MDAKSRRLFIGCRNPPKLIVMNSENGKIEASLSIGAGVDATGFQEGQVFASCRDGSLTIAGEKAGSFDVEQTVETPDGARTMGIDTGKHRIYLPTAEFEPASSGRPKAKPGTFMIVVVDR